MEDPTGDAGSESVAQSPAAGAPKSKLDNLSKDDLIKFAKKQMAAMQKMKSRCSGLEKELELLQQQSKDTKSSSEDSTLMQELTERMDALLLEKAEIQQTLSLTRKDLEKTKQQAKDDQAVFQCERDRIIDDHQNRIEALESSSMQSKTKHQEEVAHFQKLLQEREEMDREKDSEREKERQTIHASAKENTEKVQHMLEAQIETLRAELQEASSQKMELQENHQRELTEAQQEVENLRVELTQKTQQHEEDLRTIEDDYENERERLMLLHEELTEQLALKDSYLQDVKEEDEDPAPGSGIAKMLELSTSSQCESSFGDGEDRESGRLRVTLEDLHAQNTMLKEELILLGNVNGELEAELERIKEEFQVEKEELEFKVNELQMSRDSFSCTHEMSVESEQSEVVSKDLFVSPGRAQDSLTVEELRNQCEALGRERDSALAECQHIRDVLQSIETELGEKTKNFVVQYEAMKEQGVKTVQELNDQIKELSQERSDLLEEVNKSTDEKNSLMETVQELRVKVEGSTDKSSGPSSSEEDPNRIVDELKQNVEDLAAQNEDIMSQLQVKENVMQDLKQMVAAMTEERDRIEDLLKVRDEESQRLINRTGEIEKLLKEMEKYAIAVREEKEKELDKIKTETQDEVQHVKNEKERIEETLNQQLARNEETINALEQTNKKLSADIDDLHQKWEEAFSGLSKAKDEGETLASKLADVEAHLNQEVSEKQELESKLISQINEVEQASTTAQALEENQSEMLKKFTEAAEELQKRIGELEKERNLLRSRLEEAQNEKWSNDAQEEFMALIRDLEMERNMLKTNLDEVVKDTEGLQKDLQDMTAANKTISDENQNLEAQIALIAEEDEKTREEIQKKVEDMEKEKREIGERLAERDSLILQLRNDITALQALREHSADEAATIEEEANNEIAKKMAALEQELKEKDEKMNKIKAVAVKAKKELDISKKEVMNLKGETETLRAEREKMNSSMKDIIHGAEGYKNLQIDYDKQTEQLDKERERVEAGERQIAELTKRLSSATSQVESLGSEKEDLLAGLETLRSTVRQTETKNQELQRQLANLDKDLLVERTMKEQKLKDLSSVTKEVEELTAQRRVQQQQSQQTAQELELLRKEAQQSSLLDMEMADYERLVKELNAKLAEKEQSADELKSQINTLTQSEETLKQEIESLKSQVDQGDEKTSKIKQLLVKTKKDLSDAKKQEGSLMVTQASLKGELEANQQLLESSKIEVCDLTAGCHRLQEQLRSVLEQQQRTSNSLQQRIHNLQQERDSAQAELLATTGEFESYKVRVHNVLKQQKSKTTSQSEGDSGKVEREQWSSQIEQLRSRLAESQQSLQSSTAELQQLQSEHDTLLERHNRILQETISKEAELRERVLTLQSENMSLRSDLSRVQTDMSSQMEAQRQTYKDQLRKLQDDHRSTVETLQGQMRRVEEQLFSLQNQSMLVQSIRKLPATDNQRRNLDQNPTGLGLMALGDLQSMAREECEGMETTETEGSTSPLTPLPSLEHLLMSPDPKQEPFVWTVEPTTEELNEKLSTATRSMEHMNSLLHETEATNAVLMEQITLLKSELRRLERNQEREKSVANLEYLKNVLLQFIFLQSGSERQALLPVIHTMLQLSPEEKSKLAAIAQGEESAGSRGSGWSSYLHSWSGIR